MTQTLLLFGLVIVALNVVAGFLLVKRHAKWQYGVANWGIALMITLALIDKLNQIQ